MKIKKNDNVMIISGKDKGKTGIVQAVFPSLNKVIVKGIANAKKHIKPSRKNPQGGIMDINQKINLSNAILMCPNCGKPTRVEYKITDKNKTRICKKCKQNVEAGTK